MTPVTIPQRVIAPPVLVARIDRRTVAMDVRAISIDVRIAGLASETTMEITFENPHARDLEGEILFPLPEGGALCGYGLDIGGGIVDASLLPKQRAREIFDAEVRRNVDPGLLEHVAGNLFRTKVWPIPSRGHRTVRVTWVASLAFDGNDAVYELPLRFTTPKRDVSKDQAAGLPSWNRLFAADPGRSPAADAFRLRVEVAKCDVVPTLGGDLGFTEHGDGWRAETARPDEVPDLVRIALPAVPARVAVIECDEDGDRYFRIEDAPETAATTETAAPPARVGVIWDASLSRATADLSPDFAALRGLLGGWGNVEVHLLVLRDVMEDAGEFSVVAGNAEELLAALADLPRDGGTAALPELDASCDLYLLFSDGLTTLGGPDLPTAPKPVHALCSAPVANHAVLRFFAESSGGSLHDLNHQEPDEVAAGIDTGRLTFLGVEVPAGEVEDVVPSRPVRVPPGRLGVSGRLLSDEAELVLLYGRGTEVTERRSYVLRSADARTSRLVPRLFAQAHADELSVLPDRHAKALLALGRRFGIVTPNSSLLVLETLEQHIEHDVEPAPSRKALHADWMKYRRSAEVGESRRLAEKLDRVRGWWKERVEWWEKKHEPKPPSRESSERDRELRASLGEEMSLDDMALEAAPPPPSSSSPRFLARMRSPAPAAHEAPPADEPSSMEKGVAVRGWDPDTPYLGALRAVGSDDVYGTYLGFRTEYSRSPSFFLDCANHFYGIGRKDLARRVLSNVVELDLDNPALLRICAYKLGTEGDHEAAAEILSRVLAMRPDEPQSFRDLALALELTGSYRRAAELLWKVVTGDWDHRFPKIETIALIELAHVIERARAEGAWVDTDALGIDGSLVKLLDVDLRVTLAWDADNTDVDLWVIEPGGEKCFFQHALTSIGGRISDDFTGGYGPEEYMVRRARRGPYAVKANFYSSSQQNLVGPATILATIYTDYGRPDEKRRVVTVRVEEVKEVLDIAEATVG